MNHVYISYDQLFDEYVFNFNFKCTVMGRVIPLCPLRGRNHGLVIY